MILALVLAAPVAAQPASATLTAAPLKAKVTVRFDKRGIPYISAANDHDLYFAEGYLMARDRLWQMDLLRRVARGQTAELFGTAALERDKRWRTFGFAAVAEETLQYLDPGIRSALDDFAEGVNFYISTLSPDAMPPEFKILQYKPSPWRPSDSVIIGKILADALSSTWQYDVMRVEIERLPAEKRASATDTTSPYDVVLYGSDAKRRSANSGAAVPEVAPHASDIAAASAEVRRESLEFTGLFAEDIAASNNWVIGGSRTASGKPMLANDPHLQPATPGIWYMNELSAPGLHVAGVTLPGVPGVVLGHNDNIAWGATNVGPDVQDIYIEKADAQGRYLTASGPKDAVKRVEKISVRMNPLKNELTEVDLIVKVSPHGPIVMTDEKGSDYALNWTAFDPRSSDFQSFYGLNRAKDWKQFTSSLSTYGGATQNFIYADVKGHIGWYAAGKIPLRRKGDGSLPYDGSTTDGDWTGWIPFGELPHLYDPPSGVIVTANQRTAGTDYKYAPFTRDFAAPWRARRILDLLSRAKNIDAAYFAGVQRDAFNIPLKHLSDKIVETGAASAETISVLKAWDGFMLPESSAAPIVNEIFTCMSNKIAAANKGVPAALIRERILDGEIAGRTHIWLPASYKNYNEMMRECDGESAAALAKLLGSDRTQWTWGKMFTSSFPHPLASIPLIGAQFAAPKIPIAGSRQSPNVGSAVSMRFIATPGDWDNTHHAIPMGESGAPGSPHFADQFNAWLTGEGDVFPFSAKAVEAAAVETLTMSPR